MTSPQDTTSTADLVRRAFAAYQDGMANDGDLTEMEQFFARDFVHEVGPEGSDLAGRYEGFDAFAEFLKLSSSAPDFDLAEPDIQDTSNITDQNTATMTLRVFMRGGHSDDVIEFVGDGHAIVSSAHHIENAALAAQHFPLGSTAAAQSGSSQTAASGLRHLGTGTGLADAGGNVPGRHRALGDAPNHGYL